MEKNTLLLYVFLVADNSAGEEKWSLIRFLALKLFVDLTETGKRLYLFTLAADDRPWGCTPSLQIRLNIF